jgi:chemotaxis protein MotB
MVTLCLTFFILLYSFSTLDAIKWKSVVSSLQGALGPLDGGKSILEQAADQIPGNDGSAARNLEAQLDPGRVQDLLRYQQEMIMLEQVKDKLNQYLGEKGLSASVTVATEERGLVLRFQESVLFKKSRADLLEGSKEVLQEVTSILKEIDNPIRIEGHTDDLPINTPRFPSNWELSTARATNVLRFLIQEGLPGQRLSAVGYGEFHPLVPNTSETNREKNRRVDIVIIRESLRLNEPK